MLKMTPLKANNDYVRVNVIFTVSWNDSRLASDSVIDRDVPTSSIWIPDLRVNDIDSVIQIDPKLARVSPSGSVRMILSTPVALWSFMEFKNYPYDVHEFRYQKYYGYKNIIHKYYILYSNQRPAPN